MILNRYTLKKYIKDELTVRRLLQKASEYGISFDKMGTNHRGHLVAMNHFRKDEWIAKHKEHTKKVSERFREANNRLLKSIEGVM